MLMVGIFRKIYQKIQKSIKNLLKNAKMLIFVAQM